MGHIQPAGKQRSRGNRFTGVASDGDEDESEGEFAMNVASTSRMDIDDVSDKREGFSKERPVVVVDSVPTASAAEQAAQPTVAVGSALQRNADGSVVAPRVLKKKEKGKKVRLPC